MKAGIAQIQPVKGDISANIEKHLAAIECAWELESTVLFFPELSLTSYEPRLARQLATTQNDNRFRVFQRASNTKEMTIGIGVPLKTDSGIRISMLIFQPNLPIQTYSKQCLHEDETPFFEPGTTQHLISVNELKIAPAICYESLQPSHLQNARHLGCDIFVASVAKSRQGVDRAMAYFPDIAKKYMMPVFISNSVGYCDDFLSAGCSAIWSDDGKPAGQLDDKSEGVLIFDTETKETTQQMI